MKRFVIISSLFHLVLLIYLMSFGILDMDLFSIQNPSKPMHVRIASSGVLSSQNEVWQQVNHYAQMSKEERLSELQRLMKKSESIAPTSIDEIGTHFGLDATSHVAKITNKPFDFKSSTLHSIKQKEYPDSKMGYIMTLVDAAGTTLDIHYAPEDVTPDLIVSYRAMALLEINPALKQLAIRFLAKMTKPSQRNDKKNTTLPTK